MLKGYEHYRKTPEAIWYDQIPNAWDSTKMRTLFSERRTKVSDKEYPPLSVGKMGVVPQLETAVKTDNGDNRKLIREGDFAINSRSDRKGSSGISDYTGSASLIITVLEPFNELNRKYYHYLLKSNGFVEEFYRNGRGLVSDLWTTKWQEMKNIFIPVPPKEEQDQIVRYLDWKVAEMNRFIHEKKKQIQKLEELRKSIISHIVTKGIHDDTSMKNTGLDWLGEIPEHWDITRVRNNYIMQNGISESGAFFEKGTPFVNYSDVYKNRILPVQFEDVADSNEQQQEIFSVRKGDIFFTRTSETIDEIGIASVCMQDVPQAVFSGFLIRARAKNDRLNPEYVGFYLQSQCVRNYFTKEMNLVIRASLGQNLLKSLYIPVPSKEEQNEIVEYLNKTIVMFDNLISNINQEIALVEELKTKTIADVVTGQVDVGDVIIPDYTVDTDEDFDSEDIDCASKEVDIEEE